MAWPTTVLTRDGQRAQKSRLMPVFSVLVDAETGTRKAQLFGEKRCADSKPLPAILTQGKIATTGTETVSFACFMINVWFGVLVLCLFLLWFFNN